MRWRSNHRLISAQAGGGANTQISQRKIWKRLHLQIGLFS